jgi:hypothetical protein
MLSKHEKWVTSMGKMNFWLKKSGKFRKNYQKWYKNYLMLSKHIN